MQRRRVAVDGRPRPRPRPRPPVGRRVLHVRRRGVGAEADVGVRVGVTRGRRVGVAAASRAPARVGELRAGEVLLHPFVVGVVMQPPSVLCRRRSVALPPVLEPVANLGWGEARSLRQLALLGRVGVRVLQVPLAQQRPRPLLEAVRLLLAVPDGARQRVLLAHAVLVHGAERPAAELLRLLVVRLQPHGLELAVRVFGELVVLEDRVELSEVAAVKGDNGASAQHRLALVELADVGVRDGQRPEEARQPLDVAALLERLAHGRHLLFRKLKIASQFQYLNAVLGQSLHLPQLLWFLVPYHWEV